MDTGRQLKKAHAELLCAIDAMEAVVRADAPDRTVLADVRWKISRASSNRVRLLEGRVYPEMLASASPSACERVKRLRAAGIILRAASSEHVKIWTIDNAVAAWECYRRASAAMTASMRVRVAEECDILYPLLGRTSGQFAAPVVELGRKWPSGPVARPPEYAAA
jgi:hypothetical protein